MSPLLKVETKIVSSLHPKGACPKLINFNTESMYLRQMMATVFVIIFDAKLRFFALWASPYTVRSRELSSSKQYNHEG